MEMFDFGACCCPEHLYLPVSYSREILAGVEQIVAHRGVSVELYPDFTPVINTLKD